MPDDTPQPSPLVCIMRDGILIEVPWEEQARRVLQALDHFLKMPEIREVGLAWGPDLLIELGDALNGVLGIPRYTIQDDTRGASGQIITCHLCGLTSVNPNDVAQRFCGACQVFHEDREG